LLQGEVVRNILITLGFLLLFPSLALADWALYEETNVKDTISGTIKKDTIIEMKSGAIYQVHERVRMRVRERKPDTIVLRDGKYYKLIIDGFDEPLICIQLVEPRRVVSSNTNTASSDVVNTYIQGDFEGWEGETVFVLDNGQIWQQSSYAYMYQYAYRPEVIIINISGSWKMKVEGVDEMIDVIRLK